MAWRSPTDVNMTKGVDSLLPYLSEVTNFWFGRMIMISIFVIFLFGYLRSNEGDYVGGFAVSSYVTFVSTTFLWILDVVSAIDFGIMVGITVVSTLVLLGQKK